MFIFVHKIGRTILTTIYAGVDDEEQLPGIDYAAAFANYLLSHGMSQQQLNDLVRVLTEF